MKNAGAWALLGGVAGGVLVRRLWQKKYAAQGSLLSSTLQERDLLRVWFLLNQQGARLEEFFAAVGYCTLAVLGMGWEGRRAIKELGELVSCGIEIDQPGAVHEYLEVIRLGDDPLPPVDCVLICDQQWTEEKRAAVQAEFSGDIVSLAQVLSWLQKKYQLQPRDGIPENWPRPAPAQTDRG